MKKLSKTETVSIDEEVDQIISDQKFRTSFRNSVYKFGSHKFLFRWSDTSKAWIKSDIDPDIIRQRIFTQVRLQREYANATV